MKYIRSALLLLVIVVLCGCFTAPVVPPRAGGFMNIEAPLDITFDNTQIGPKRGESQSIAILGLFAFGDASVAAAAKNGLIEKLDHTGYSVLNILGIVTIWKTIAYGE